MCSNMCARPVIPGTSCALPALTTVAYEKTGASCRSSTITVKPFASFRTVTFFSNDARSCAHRGAAVIRSRKKDAILRTPLIENLQKFWVAQAGAYSLPGRTGCPVYEPHSREVSYDCAMRIA